MYKVTWKDRLCGVIVLRIYNDLKGRKCCLLADWIYDESAPKLFSVMLAHAIHVNWQEDIFYFLNKRKSPEARRQSFRELEHKKELMAHY